MYSFDRRGDNPCFRVQNCLLTKPTRTPQSGLNTAPGRDVQNPEAGEGREVGQEAQQGLGSLKLT